jgi:hypothetical protein
VFVRALDGSLDRRLVSQKGGRPAKPRRDARQSDLDLGFDEILKSGVLSQLQNDW